MSCMPQHIVETVREPGPKLIVILQVRFMWILNNNRQYPLSTFSHSSSRKRAQMQTMVLSSISSFSDDDDDE